MVKKSGGKMKVVKFISVVLFMILLINCQQQSSSGQESVKPSDKDGVFIHVSHGSESPHRVLMALNMAVMMAQDRDVLVYFDISGVNVVLQDSPDIRFNEFPGSKSQLETLKSMDISLLVCPGCLKAAGKTSQDLMPGIAMADKDKFFNFTKGRILTLDY
jgi:predicted peroxiredoxin